METELVNFDVPDGALAALRFGTGPNIAIAAHGITASGMSYRAVARHLPEDWSTPVTRPGSGPARHAKWGSGMELETSNRSGRRP